MINSTQVVFRGLDHSDAVEMAIKKRVEKLSRYKDNIQSLRIILEAPHNHQHKGNVYHVGLEVHIPNHDVSVTNDQHDKHQHEDIYVAIRDSFDALERRLKSITEKERKARRTPPPELIEEANDQSAVA
jgi:ribosomal subunit interface protein